MIKDLHDDLLSIKAFSTHQKSTYIWYPYLSKEVRLNSLFKSLIYPQNGKTLCVINSYVTALSIMNLKPMCSKVISFLLHQLPLSIFLQKISCTSCDITIFNEFVTPFGTWILHNIVNNTNNESYTKYYVWNLLWQKFEATSANIQCFLIYIKWDKFDANHVLIAVISNSSTACKIFENDKRKDNNYMLLLDTDFKFIYSLGQIRKKALLLDPCAKDVFNDYLLLHGNVICIYQLKCIKTIRKITLRLSRKIKRQRI